MRSSYDTPPSPRESPIVLIVCRSGALFFLYWHTALYFRDSLSVIFVFVSFAASQASAWITHKLRLRLFFALTTAAALPWALLLIVRIALSVFNTGDNPEVWDILALAFERNFGILIAPWTMATLTTLLFFRFRGYAAGEAALFGFLAVPVFWTQGNFHVDLYTHPFTFGIALFFFIVAELLILILSERMAGMRSFTVVSRGGNKPRGFYSSALLFAALGILLLKLFSLYSDASVTAGGGLLKPDLFRFDFSNYLHLENEIRLSKDLVLLYRRGEPVDRYLIRRYVLDGYRPGRMFFQDPGSPSPSRPENVPDRPLRLPLRETEGRINITQELYLVNLDPSALVTLDYPTTITPYRNRKNSSFTRMYRVDAAACGILPFELSDVPDAGMEENLLAYYTQYGGDPKIQDLAQEITEGIQGYYDRVQSIHDYLKYEYYYSLKPGIAADGNLLHHFLFSSRKGYCSYFAFAMALLCRSAGIPARVAVGFFIEPETEVLGFYPVRSDMAHAWVEVYFAEFGWIDFDPTSRTPAPGENFEPAGGIENEKIASLLGEILSHGIDPEGTEEVPGEPPGVERWPATLLRFAAKLKILLPLLAAAFLTVYRLRFYLAARFAADRRIRTVLNFRFLLQNLRGRGHTPRECESVAEYLLRSEAEPPPSLLEALRLYQKARFSDRFDEEDAAAFLAAASEYRHELTRTVSLPRRMLGYIHPASFRRRP